MAKYDPNQHPCGECGTPIYGTQAATWNGRDQEIHQACADEG